MELFDGCVSVTFFECIYEIEYHDTILSGQVAMVARKSRVDQFKAAKQELEAVLRKAEIEERRIIKEAEEARECTWLYLALADKRVEVVSYC
jgi:hypothetical protein